MDKFADIRPFTDCEVADAVNAILADDGFITAIRRLRWPLAPDAINFLLLPLTRLMLKHQLNGVTSSDNFQQRMFPYVDHMVATTVRKFSISGLGNLSANKNYLFISNHRDITLDAALTGRAIFHRLHKTPRNAIGNNLLHPDFASKLFKLNKCFIVNRHISSPQKRLSHLRHLSAYIYFCLKDDNHCVWLAQKEGRAKDGLDKTDPAIIKMLAMNKRSDQTFSDFIKTLNIIPVSISYAYDPCDTVKANELYMLATTGSYRKTEDEDFNSIGQGILGYKGDVHINIGATINANLNDANATAQFLDQEIIRNYKLHASNFLAYRQLYGELPCWFQDEVDLLHTNKEESFFMQRLKAVPQYLQHYWLTIYANPIVSKSSLHNFYSISKP